MTRIKFIPSMNRYYVLFEDGSRGWCSLRGIEGLFPGRDWDVMKKNPQQWFYM